MLIWLRWCTTAPPGTSVEPAVGPTTNWQCWRSFTVHWSSSPIGCPPRGPPAPVQAARENAGHLVGDGRCRTSGDQSAASLRLLGPTRSDIRWQAKAGESVDLALFSLARGAVIGNRPCRTDQRSLQSSKERMEIVGAAYPVRQKWTRPVVWECVHFCVRARLTKPSRLNDTQGFGSRTRYVLRWQPPSPRPCGVWNDGLARTHLQYVLSAPLVRIDAVLTSTPCDKARRSCFACAARGLRSLRFGVAFVNKLLRAWV
jgi:hypothetical protein